MVGDGWCGRRIRKPAREFGKLPFDTQDVCPVHSLGVLMEARRLAYLIRTKPMDKRTRFAAIRVYQGLDSVVRRIPPPAVRAPPGPKTVTPPKPKTARPAVGRRPGLGWHDSHFVKAKEVAVVARPPPRVVSITRTIEKVEPWYSCTVQALGTPSEDTLLRKLRWQYIESGAPNEFSRPDVVALLLQEDDIEAVRAHPYLSRVIPDLRVGVHIPILAMSRLSPRSGYTLTTEIVRNPDSQLQADIEDLAAQKQISDWFSRMGLS